MFMLILMSTLLLTISSAMLLALNPLSLGIIILLISVLLSLIFSSTMSSWVAFLIFLIYVGGMLVMFAYFVSMIPNQSTDMSVLYLPLMMTVIILAIMPNNIKLIMQTNMLKFTNTFYSYNNTSMLMLLALTLLLAMVVVVKIVVNTKGPLRPFNNYV